MGPLRALWRLAVSPATFAVLCLLWCLDLGAGSLLAHGRPDLFGTMDAYPFARWLREVGARILPQSAWVYLLAALAWCMTASLLLCTVNWLWRRRRRLRSAGEVLVHLGFLLVFAGFVAGATRGERSHGVTVAVGREAPVPGMDLRLAVRAVAFVRGARGEVLDTVSTLALRDAAGGLTEGTARLNHPLIRGATVVYPRGAEEVRTPYGSFTVARYDVHRDPGVRLVLPGAALLVLGTLWSLAAYLGRGDGESGYTARGEADGAARGLPEEARLRENA